MGGAVLRGEGEPSAPAIRFPRQIGRRAAGLILWVLLAFLVVKPDLVALNQRLAPGSPVKSTVFPGSFRTFSIEKDARPGPLPHVFRFAYPADWLNRDQESEPPLAVFVDGLKAAWLIEEPFFDDLGPERAYAYLREATSRSFFVVCPQTGKCARVDIIRNDARARLALAWTFRNLAGPVLARVALELAILALLAWLVSKRLSTPLLAVLLALEAWIVLGSDDAAGSATALRAVAVAGVGLAVTPLGALIKRGFGWARHVLSQPPGVESSAKVSIFALVAIVSAWPGFRTVPGWYPADTDDSYFYVFAASRFLRTDDLVHAALQPDNWRYSAYPLVLAVFSRIFGLHPMDAYSWVSVLGAIALVSAAGALAWVATGRFTTGLLATWISGTWGGLGGWVWLFAGVSSLFTGDAIRLLDSDFHEPRFLGEFTGPYSELTTYITSAPFYPREAGLVPFWLGLGLLYRRLRPGLRPPSLIAVCALFLISAAIYPYYGLAAALALCVAAIAEGRGDEVMRLRRRRTISASALVALVAVVVGDLASRVYRGFSVWGWLSAFFESAPMALAVDNDKPSLDFLATRILGGEFFIGLAFVGALGLGLRPRGSFSEPQRRAALITLAICVAHGLASEASRYLHLLFFNFRWFVSWRALLTPIAALVAALFIEQLVARAKSRPLVRLATLAVIPALSGFLWSHSVTDYLTREKERGTRRGLMAHRWSEYRDHGRAVLGHVVIPEPLAIEGAVPGDMAAASAAFGIVVQEGADLFKNDAALLSLSLGAPGNVSSVALRADSSASVGLQATGCCARIASFGGYDVYVRREAVEAPARPSAPTR